MSRRPVVLGDRCPGALRLHEAADGPLSRIRVPGGRVTAAQLEALSDVADALGDGVVHITARGNVELRAIHNAQALTDALAGCGLLPSRSHERVRNIVASPEPIVDALVAAVDRAICAVDGLTELSGRFLFGVDAGSGDILTLDPDITAVLRPDGWAALVLAGHPTGYGVAAHDVPAAAAAAATAFVARAQGSWRLRNAREEHRAALRSAMLTAVHHRVDTRRDSDPLPSDPGFGPAPGRSSDGRRLTIALSLGEASTANWRRLAAIARRGDGIVRLTPWRRVVVCGLSPSVDVGDLILDGELILDATDPAVGLGACTGRPGCAKALADVRAGARRSIQPGVEPAHPVRLPSREAPVYWAGCSRACGHPVAAHTRIVATESGYQVETHPAQAPNRPAAHP